MIQMNLFAELEKRCRGRRLWTCEQRGKWGTGKSSSDIYPLPREKQIPSGRRPYSTGSSPPPPWWPGGVGGKLGREGMHAYIQLIHFAVQQKQTATLQSNYDPTTATKSSWLQKLKFTASWFWKLEVWNQGANRVDSSWGLWGEPVPGTSPSSQWCVAHLQCCLACRSSTLMCAFKFTCILPVYTFASKSSLFYKEASHTALRAHPIPL